MNTLAFSSMKELIQKLDAREISPEELLEFCIRRFEAFDPHIGAALEVFDKKSILQHCSGQGSLRGIPGLIKDNICQKDRIASCASKILANFRSPYDATVIERLKADGALLIGRANMDEFAMGSSTESSAFKKTANPWDLSRVPGGSSGGSAAAVAAGLVPWALGSETGGSVRQPAALCGVVGIKPTYGLVSRYGLIAYASSLDQIGVVTRTVYDNALVLSTIAGHDDKDSSNIGAPKQDYTQGLSDTLPKNIRIGLIHNSLNAEGIDNQIVTAIEQAIKVLEKQGAHISHITLPTLDYAAAAYFILSRAEAASNLARFDGVRYGMRNEEAQSLAQMYSATRHDGFGAEVKSRIAIGNYVLSAGHASEFYANAKKVVRIMRHEFTEAFKEVDLLIMPTHPTPAFAFGAYDVNKLQMDLQDYFTCPMNLVGIPAISLPCGFTNNTLPIGFQLIGPHLSESLLYQVGHVYEQNTRWYTQHPMII